MKDMPIAVRLGLGFGFVALLLLITTVLGIGKMGRMNDATREIVQHRYVQTAIVARVAQLTLDNGRQLRSMVLVESSADVEKFRQIVERNRAENSASLAKLEKMIDSPKGTELMSAIKQTREALNALYPALYAQIQSDRKQAAEFLLKEFAPRNTAYAKALNDMGDFQAQLMDESAKEAEAGFQNTRLTMILVGACALAAAIAVTVLITRSVTQQLGGEPAYAANVVAVIAQGNLTEPIAVRAGDTSSLLAKMQGMQTYLRDIIGKIHQAAEAMGSASQQLATTAQQVAESATQQSESSAAMAASVEELTVSINHVSENAKGAHALADEARQLSMSGERQVQETIADINRIAGAVGSATQSIHDLGEQSDQISNIVNVIKEIADQTNLLALNAAIEAARAGEQGRGFAVVADEVRKLAEKTTTSTQEIASMITAVQSVAKASIEQMEVGTAQVESGVTAAANTGASMKEIETSARKVLESVDEISTALREQSTSSNEIARNIEHTAQLTEENGAAVNEVFRSAEHLDQLAQTLKEAVSHFRV